VELTTLAVMVLLGVLLVAILQSKPLVLERLALGGLAFTGVAALGVALLRHAFSGSYEPEAGLAFVAAALAFGMLAAHFRPTPRPWKTVEDATEWLGVLLTGTDAVSNARFGSLQLITATQLGLSPVSWITLANSTGGVMNKVIDAQSICVATAATDRLGTEADIFRYVVWHSLILASIVGAIMMLQAYVWPSTLLVPQILR
jgi:hypothetical protein